VADPTKELLDEVLTLLAAQLPQLERDVAELESMSPYRKPTSAAGQRMMAAAPALVAAARELVWIGSAAIVPSSTDLSSAPTIATSSVARDVTFSSMVDLSDLRGHVLVLLGIIDATGGFMSPDNQEALRQARKAVGA